MANTNCFLDYAGLELFWSKVKDVIENNELVTANAITNLDTRIGNLESTKSNIGHTHDDRYYTESEINNLLATKSDTNHTHTFASLTSKPTTISGYGITDAASKDHTHNFYIGTTKVQSSSSSQNLTGINTLNANKIAVEGTDSPKSLNITGEAITLVDDNLMGYHAIDSEGSTFYYGGGEEVFRHTTTSFEYENTGMGISTKLIIPKKNGTIATKEDTVDLVSIPFTNPVGGWCPDPCFWKGDDGYFYIKGTGRLVTVKRTRDFVNYEDTGRTFISTEAQNELFDLYGHYATNDSKYKLHPNYWAPFVIKIGDNWVLYQAIIERTGTTTNTVDGTAHIVAFTSKTPYGNFSNPVTIVSDNEITAAYDSSTKWNNIIDPFVYCDPFDNHIYLLAGSSYAIRRKRLSDDGLSMYKDGSTLAVDNYAMHVAGQTIKTDPSRATVYEGTYLYNKIGKWGNYWYLFVSSGSYDSRDYCVKVGRCPNANYHIGGTTNINFQDKASRIMRAGGGTTILSTESESSNFWGPGHIGGIFETEDGKTWMLYHCHDGNGNQDRKLFIQELLWDEDGWPYFENNGHPISTGRISKHIITSTNDVYCKKDITEITWSSLKSLRDNGNLIPGMQYRIIDYTCTTTQANTRSAGHVFDIIVTADSTNALNEVARAVKHEGDTYFSSVNSPCDLNAWKIWYCLDNDTTRFAWADSTNGKGVIYRMIDEHNNDCPYDFKNIQFKDPKDTTTYPDYYYTFDSGDGSDYSVNSSTNSNKILPYTNAGKQILNCIIFMGGNCHGNTFDYDCYNNAFRSNCCNNTFGNGCYGNALKSTCNSNTFGGNCYNNTFGTTCKDNTFGNNCYSNTFGNSCSNNTIGNGCYSNTFDSYCSSNIFGVDCHNNTFGSDCSDNTFGNSCSNNTTDVDFMRNTFGNSCSNNSFGSEIFDNTFGPNCSYNTFGMDCSQNTFGSYCQYIKFASDSSASTKYDKYAYNHFGDGCQYILFTGTGAIESYTDQVKNYTFAQGLQGTSSLYLTVNGVRNRSYETKVAKNSAGELKIYCEADLIQ